MNNKEKLYLVKAANKFYPRPSSDYTKGVQGMGLYSLHKQLNSQPKYDTFKRSGAPKDMFGTGEGFKPKPTLPNKPLPFQRPMRDSRYQLPAYTKSGAESPLIQQLTRQYKHRPSVISNASYESVDGSPYKRTSGSSKLNPATYADLPTAKGGLQNIPPRPPSHPLSKQTQGLADPKAFQNTMNRMDRGMPVQLHKPYGK